jgi:hypothetical protein
MNGEPIDVTFRVRPSERDPWKSMRSRGAARVDEDGKIVCWYGCLEAADEAS